MTLRKFKSVILGPPGVGKGTLSSYILELYDVIYISCGDKLRQHVLEGTSIGLEAAKYINDGKLVPDDVMIKFISVELQKLPNTTWLLDGFPRTLSQAEALWEKEKLDLAINLVVHPEVIISRVEGRWVHLPSGRVYNDTFNKPKVAGRDDVTGEPLSKREDDKPEVVRKRLELYEQLTRPVIEFYRKKNILREFYGKTSDEISPKVFDCLNEFSAPIKN